jgi:hypothetical protein
VQALAKAADDTDPHGPTDPHTRVDQSPSAEWNEDDYDVLADGVVVGRIIKAMAAPQGTS